jgi:hypothetical protein
MIHKSDQGFDFCAFLPWASDTAVIAAAFATTNSLSTISTYRNTYVSIDFIKIGVTE